MDDVIKRAKLNNVNYLLTISTTLKSFEKIKLIVGKYKNVYGTLGISIDILYNSYDIPHKDQKLDNFPKNNEVQNQFLEKKIDITKLQEKKANEKKLISIPKRVIKTNLKNIKKLIKKFLK